MEEKRRGRCANFTASLYMSASRCVVNTCTVGIKLCCENEWEDFDFVYYTVKHYFICCLSEISLQGKKVVPCRFDWHQTGSQVIISIYAKNAVPELSYVDANSTTVSETTVCQIISVQI